MNDKKVTLETITPEYIEWANKTLSRISTMSHEMAKDLGVSYKEALQEVLGMVAITEGKSSGDALYSELMRCANIQGRMKRGQKSPKLPISICDELPVDTSGWPLTNLYRAWCEIYNFVPSDKWFSFFLDKSRGTTSYARRKLKNEGWIFAKADKGIGWWIVKRPEPKPEPMPEPEPGPKPKSDDPFLRGEVAALKEMIQELIDNQLR